MFDIRHAHLLCHFPDRQIGRLQKHDGHVHFVIQHILVQRQAGIFQNQGTDIVFVIIKLLRQFLVGQGPVIKTMHILQDFICLFVIDALALVGGQARGLNQDILQQSAAAHVVIQVVITVLFRNLDKFLLKLKGIFQVGRGNSIDVRLPLLVLGNKSTGRSCPGYYQ